MIVQEPVKIPESPGRIRYMKKEDKEYVLYLTGRKYNTEKHYNEPDWVLIGRQTDEMPGLMYPNDNYERYFGEENKEMEQSMTPAEQLYIRNKSTYGLYITFFDGLYHEFKQQARKKADEPVNRYKAESLNKVLQPLKQMMKDEEYADLLGLIKIRNEVDKKGMSHSDVMILMTQYKSALVKYHRNHS